MDNNERKEWVARVIKEQTSCIKEIRFEHDHLATDILQDIRVWLWKASGNPPEKLN